MGGRHGFANVHYPPPYVPAFCLVIELDFLILSIPYTNLLYIQKILVVPLQFAVRK